MNKKEIINRLLVRIKDVEGLKEDIEALKREYDNDDVVCKCGTECDCNKQENE